MIHNYNLKEALYLKIYIKRVTNKINKYYKSTLIHEYKSLYRMTIKALQVQLYKY